MCRLAHLLGTLQRLDLRANQIGDAGRQLAARVEL